jgi:tRNA threonylcarbamoyladenosine biosynthesis protein TsaE
MGGIKIISHSEKETQALAKRLGLELRPNDCVALVGNFGSGKTVFTKGLACGAGFKKKDYVCSPSFVILKIYRGRLPFYHFDLYRLNSFAELENVGLDEFMEAGGVAAIEWAEKIKRFLPARSLKIEFSVLGPKKRSIEISSQHPRWKNILKKLRHES